MSGGNEKIVEGGRRRRGSVPGGRLHARVVAAVTSIVVAVISRARAAVDRERGRDPAVDLGRGVHHEATTRPLACPDGGPRLPARDGSPARPGMDVHGGARVPLAVG